MAERMEPGRLAGLHRAAAAARVAEEARLARVMSEIAACRERADGLRRSIAEPALGAASVEAADLAAASRWRDRLASAARAEAARAEALGKEAREARARLARAFGRERALAELLDRSQREARRVAERRAEAAWPPSGGASQSSPPEPEPASGGTSAGSPGMA